MLHQQYDDKPITIPRPITIKYNVYETYLLAEKFTPYTWTTSMFNSSNGFT